MFYLFSIFCVFFYLFPFYRASQNTTRLSEVSSLYKDCYYYDDAACYTAGMSMSEIPVPSSRCNKLPQTSRTLQRILADPNIIMLHVTRQVCQCRKFQSHHQDATSYLRLQGLFGGSLLIPARLFFAVLPALYQRLCFSGSPPVSSE